MSELATASRHSSESSDHYTPRHIVAAARVSLGSIDLDPASCAEANEEIKASTYYSEADDGFTRPWSGRVFLNPPGGLSDEHQRPVKKKCREDGSCGLPLPHAHDGVAANQKKWWQKLAREFHGGAVESAIFICFSVELLQNTQCRAPVGFPIPLDFPICFPASRIKYVKPGGAIGAAPPHASCIVMLGGDADKFKSAFGPIGRCIVPGASWAKRATLFQEAGQ